MLFPMIQFGGIFLFSVREVRTKLPCSVLLHRGGEEWDNLDLNLGSWTRNYLALASLTQRMSGWHKAVAASSHRWVEMFVWFHFAGKCLEFPDVCPVRKHTYNGENA